MPKFDEISKKFNLQVVINVFLRVLSEKILEDINSQIKKRLYNFGIAGDGQKLRTDEADPFYAKSTEYIKHFKNQPINRVTLFDTGEFYNSFEIEKIQNGFLITANFNKKEGYIGQNFTKSYVSNVQFENAITSLTEKEQEILLKYLNPKIIKELKKEL